jgi:hypothetical protein
MVDIDELENRIKQRIAEWLEDCVPDDMAAVAQYVLGGFWSYGEDGVFSLSELDEE